MLIDNVSMANIMRCVSIYLTPIFMLFGTILANSMMAKTYPYVLQDADLPSPKPRCLFMMAITLQIIAFIVGVTEDLPFKDIALRSAAFRLMIGLNHVMTAVGLTVAGICCAHFRQGLQSVRNQKLDAKTAVLTAQLVISRFTFLKQFLSTLLFVQLVCHSGVLILKSFLLLTTRQDRSMVLLAQLCSSLMAAIFLCSAVDKSTDEYKSLSHAVFRYVYKVLHKNCSHPFLARAKLPLVVKKLPALLATSPLHLTSIPHILPIGKVSGIKRNLKTGSGSRQKDRIRIQNLCFENFPSIL